MTRPARFSQSDLTRAKRAADKAGLRLTGCEIKPDGTIKFEFGEHEIVSDWRAGSPLYEGRA
jgi:hypothetical protein